MEPVKIEDYGWKVIYEHLNKGKHSKKDFKIEFDRKVLENRGLVSYVISKYTNRRRTVNFEDLTQSGYIGLIQSVNRYDPTRGIKFSTFAFNNIKKHVLYVMFKDRAVSAPIWCNEMRLRINKELKMAEMRGEAMPSSAELSKRIGSRVDTIDSFLNSSNTFSITPGGESFGWDQPDESEYVIPDRNIELSDITRKAYIGIDHLISIGKLNKRDLYIFKRRMDPCEEMNSFPEIGRDLGISRQLVQFRHKRVISLLKKMLA